MGGERICEGELKTDDEKPNRIGEVSGSSSRMFSDGRATIICMGFILVRYMYII